jgi:hypothetical protein
MAFVHPMSTQNSDLARETKRSRDHKEIDENTINKQKMKFESISLNEMRTKLDSLGQEHIYKQLKGFDTGHPIFEQVTFFYDFEVSFVHNFSFSTVIKIGYCSID